MAVFDGVIERHDPYGLRNGAGGCELQEVGTAIGYIETQNRADDDPSYSAFDSYQNADGRIAVTFRDETAVIGVFNDLDSVRDAINPPGNLRALFAPHGACNYEVLIE